MTVKLPTTAGVGRVRPGKGWHGAGMGIENHCGRLPADQDIRHPRTCHRPRVTIRISYSGCKHGRYLAILSVDLYIRTSYCDIGAFDFDIGCIQADAGLAGDRDASQ